VGREETVMARGGRRRSQSRSRYHKRALGGRDIELEYRIAYEAGKSDAGLVIRRMGDDADPGDLPTATGKETEEGSQEAG
jgi:hypothetical protein